MKKDSSDKKEDNSKEKGNEKGEEVKEEQKEEKLVELKKGDYTVHILIEEIKNLVNTEEDKLPLPRVKISCLGAEKRTEKPACTCSDYVFNEHFYFEKTNLTKEMLDSEKINFEVYDINNAGREHYFGMFEFDYSFVYGKEKHALQNFWMALANPEGKDFTQVRGYLKLSISILHENDERIELEMKETDSKDCMVPTQVKMEFMQINLNIFKAENIPDMEQGLSRKENTGSKAQCDGIIEIKYGGLSLVTKVVPMVKQVINWNQTVSFPVMIPAVSQKIVLIIKDHEDISRDDLVGSIEIKIDDIFKDKYKKPTFFDIYGAYANDNTDKHDLMNTNAEIGSRWKGRLLLSASSKKAEKGGAEVKDIMDETMLKEANSTGRPFSWTLLFGVYDSLFLPWEDKKLSLRIAIGDVMETTPVIKANKYYVNWAFSKKKTILTSSDKIEEVPDIFIYIMDKFNSKVHTYQRLKAEDVYKNKDILAIKMFPELTTKKVDNLMESGILKIRIGIFNSKLDYFNESDFKVDAPGEKGKKPQKELKAGMDLEDLMEEEDEPLKETIPDPGMQKCTIVAVIYMTKGLLPADSNGKSDPYVTLNIGTETQKTDIKYETVNGIWNQLLIFKNIKMNVQDKTTWPVFFLKVIDHNVLKDKVMNYCYIWLSAANYQVNDIKTMTPPKWFKLLLPESNKQQGKILISFYVFTSGFEHLANDIKVIPETTTYSCDFNLLGLRELKPLALLPVKKAYIKFDLNSLNFTGKKEDTLTPISTTPGEPGPNPTINSVFKFDIHLPKDPKYIPELQCEVYDNYLSGLVKSLLGVFTLDIKKIIERTNERIDKDLRALREATTRNEQEGLLNTSNSALEKIAFEESKDSSLSETESKENKKELKEPLIEKNPSKDVTIELNELQPKEPKDDPNKYGIRLPKKLPKEQLNDSHFFVIYPVFKNYKIPGYVQQQHQLKDFLVEDLDGAPDSNDFIDVGYLLKVDVGTPPDKCKKHYRRIYRCGLENVPELKIKQPFNKAYLRRGDYEDKADETSIFDLMADVNKKILVRYDDSMKSSKDSVSVLSASDAPSETGFMGDKEKNKEKKYGKFKAMLRIAEKNKFNNYLETVQKYIDDPKYDSSLKYIKKHNEICKQILNQTEVVVRVYVLRLFDLAKKDLFDESDPFIKIYLGDKLIINESENHQDDMKNCYWNKYYDLPCKMPGCGSLKLEVWDYDDLLTDDLIGSTTIDLEDRYFDQNWVGLVEKPVEVRPLLHPDESSSQGSAYLWVEIFPANLISITPPRCIESEPTTKYQVRFVVWDTEDMECMDVEGTSDIYVIGYFNPKEKQSTDTHYRCQTGVGSFNWRMLLPYETPNVNTTLTIDVYDADIFGADDYICGAKLNIKSLVDIPRFLDLPIKFTRDYYKSLTDEEKNAFGAKIEFESESEDKEGIKFWVQCVKAGKAGGRVRCSLEIIPEWKAKLTPVGNARDEPNLDPYLPPPVGRFEFTLNPYKLVNQLVGPKFRRKVYCFCCMCLCCIYLCVLIPYVVYHLSGELVNPFK